MNNKKESVFVIELKKRLIKILIVLIFAFIASSVLAEKIFSFVVNNLTPPTGVSLIISSPSSSAFILVSIILFTTLIFLLPFFIYQLIMFVKPALTQKEKHLLFNFLVIFSILFIIGITFGFIITKNVLIPFLAQLTMGTSISNLWDITEFIKFFLMICFGMGLTFQMPLIISFLVKMHLVETSTLSKFKKHIFIGILLILAFITPNGDTFSLSIVSLPLFLLFEFSLVIGRLVERRNKKQHLYG